MPPNPERETQDVPFGGNGSSVASAAAAHDVDTPAPIPISHRLARFMETCIGAFGLLSTLFVYWQTYSTLAPAGHIHQALQVLLYSVSFLLSLTLLPHAAWLKWRVWIITVVRMASALVPSQRSSTEGMAALVLGRAASPGWRGALADWCRLGIATRLLPHAGCGALLNQPLLAALVQQSIIVALIANPSGYCATPLMQDPLMQARQAAVARVLDVVPSLHLPVKEDGTDHGVGPACTCVAVVTWNSIMVGVLLPLLVLGRTRHAVLQQQPAAGGAAAAAAGCPRRGALRAMAAAAAASLLRAWDCLDAALTDIFIRGEYGGLQLGLLVWCLSGNLWLLSNAVAVRAARTVTAEPS